MASADSGREMNSFIRENHLNDSVDAGIDITVNDVPHGVGEQQAGNQNHQGADGHCVTIGCDAGGAESVGQQRHQEGGGDGSEEGIGPKPFQLIADKSYQNAADTGADSIDPTAPKEQTESGCTQETTQIFRRLRIFGDPGTNHLQPLDTLGGIGLAVAVSTAEAAVFFHSVQVIAMDTDSPHPGQNGAVLGFDADDEVIGNGKHFGFHTVGGKYPADTFFHPEGFRAAHGQLVTKVGGHIKQYIVIHVGIPRI